MMLNATESFGKLDGVMEYAALGVRVSKGLNGARMILKRIANATSAKGVVSTSMI